MRCTSSERTPRARRWAGACALALASCSFAPPPTLPRPPLAARELQIAIADVPAPTLASLLEQTPGHFCGTLEGGGECVTFHLHTEGTGRPVVLLVPILAGGDQLLEQVAMRVQARGFDVAWCTRAGSAMKQGQRGRDLDELFRRTLLHQRLLLRWLRERPCASPRQFVLGMSLGGMVTTVLAAAEPGLAGVAICLSGGDIANLVMTSSEGRVQRWRAWRHDADGIGDDELRWELGECLTHEPLRFAPMVPTGRVLLVEAALDTVVPARNQDLLWEALGRPARFTVPLGHYTAALAIDLIVARVAHHFAAQPD